MPSIENDIENQLQQVRVMRYVTEQAQNKYYQAKLELETLQTKLATEEYHLNSLYTQLNKGKR